MKRIIFIFFAAMMSTAVCSAAMSNSKVRKETRFLTDKMAYELNLSTEQYNDVYEINYDFISGIRYLMDDVLRGEEWALNRYYDYLDVRNDDLRWISQMIKIAITATGKSKINALNRTNNKLKIISATKTSVTIPIKLIF